LPNFTYEIDEQGAVWLFDGINPEPFLHQPNWADGTAWSEGEAEAWAEQVILSLTDPTADIPGDNPSEPTKPRPAPQELEPEVLPE
jgi:hypothetical protein